MLTVHSGRRGRRCRQIPPEGKPGSKLLQPVKTYTATFRNDVIPFATKINLLIARLFYLALPCLLLLTACKQDTIGDILFEVPYAPIEFSILAGEPSFETQVTPRPVLPTGVESAMSAAQVSADDIEVFGGLRARVVSITGEDFREIQRMEVRACTVGKPGGCDIGDIVFSQGDLFGRRQQSVDLSPGLLNFKTLFVGNENVRVELVFILGQSTTRSLEGRLEWAMAAFGEE